MALGAAMTAVGGLGLAYLLLAEHEPVKGFIWIMPIMILAVGIAILYDDLHDTSKR